MSVSKFINDTDWKTTLQIAATRIVAAALILTVLSFSYGDSPFWKIVPELFNWLMWLSIFMAMAIPALAMFRSGTTWASWLSLPAWLVCVADPPLKILHTKRPDLFPVAEFKYFLNAPLLQINKGRADQDYQNESEPQESSRLYQPSQTNSTPQNEFERGKQLFERGERKDGMVIIAEVAERNPGHVPSNLFMAKAFYELDPVQYHDMIFGCANNVLAVEPNNSMAINVAAATHFAEGKRAWDAEEWGKATIAFQKSYDLDSNTAGLKEALFFCSEKAKETGQSTVDLSK
jgi:hypothetical protein